MSNVGGAASFFHPTSPTVTTPPGSARHSQWLPRSSTEDNRNKLSRSPTENDRNKLSRSPTENDRSILRGHARAFKTLQRRWIPEPDDPEGHPDRTLVLCFDGTGDQFDDDNSNVVQLVAMLKKDSPAHQMVYYQTGIGTYTSPSVPAVGLRTINKVLDSMLAWNLRDHVLDGYRFLMQNYKYGDKICIFGFSRGAYTARALAGMLQKVGLLPPCNEQQVPFAWHMYAHEDEDTLHLATEFKDTYCIHVNIEFMGVWDTVASVGIVPHYLPFVNNNTAIRYFRHALALDERRAKFTPLFHAMSAEQDDKNTEKTTMNAEAAVAALKQATGISTAEEPTPGGTRKVPEREKSVYEEYERKVNDETEQETDTLEVWFAGAHADVGGGSVRNHTRHSLARIPLRWMVRECFRAETGLIFDMDMLRDELGMDVDFERKQVLEAPPRAEPGPLDIVQSLTAEQAARHVLVAAATDIAKFMIYPLQLAWWLVGSPFRNWFVHAKNQAKGLKQDKGPRTPFKGEAHEELKDALSPMYDQLELSRPWWILELLPLKRKKQKAVYTMADRAAEYVWVVNRGRGRKIFKHIVHRGVKIHRSVLTRIEALDHRGEEGSYCPAIRPNIVIKKKDGTDFRLCQRVSSKSWREGFIEGVQRPWFEWMR